MSDQLITALAVTAELCGTQLSKPAAIVLAEDLSQYPEPDILKALSRCRRELKGRLTIAEVISRIDDGRPGADEAWAMLPWEEEPTAVLTEEMMLAQGIARHAYHAGDKMGARLAFRDAYTRLVTEARESRTPVDWQISLGWDRAGRAGPILEALSKGRLTAAHAQRFLPAEDDREQLRIGEKRGGGLKRIAEYLPERTDGE